MSSKTWMTRKSVTLSQR